MHGMMWHSVGQKLVYKLIHMVVSINGVPQNRWFIMGNPTKMDDLGVPPF